MLDALFKPKSVAIIGASNNPLSIGHIIIQNLLDHNFRGPIYPVNPKSRFIKSFRAYPSISDIPDEIDLVNISIKNSLVPSVIDECGRKGVKFGIVHTAGFKEVGEEGRKLEEHIVEIAHSHGMRIYGPNSQGIQNSDPSVSVYANFTFVPMSPGNISILAQSGGVGETLKLHLYQIGLGMRMYASFGNEADVTMNEILEYYGQDEGTKVIMLHIETFKDPAGFLEVASRITPHKPVLAVKSGRTSEGVAAVASHTGSLIDQDTLANVIFEKSGVLRYDSQQEMIQAATAFSSQPLPASNKVVIVTNTGGPAILSVDECMLKGLELAKLSQETKEKLGELLFTEAIVSNPVDVIATAGAKEYGGTVEALLADPNIDSLLLNFVTPPFVDCEAVARKLAEIGKTAEKPIVCVVMTIDKWANVVRLIRESGIPVYDFPVAASRVLASMSRYSDVAAREILDVQEFAADRENARAILARHEGSNVFLPQADVFDLLDAYGIPVAKTKRIRDEGDLEAAAQDLGYPVVLKVDSAEIVHKSDAGGVRLGIEDLDSLVAAFREMQQKFGDVHPEYVLQNHVKTGTEVIMGVKGNGSLAPTILFGLGGIFVEILKDVQLRLAPLTEADAMAMISSIKGYPVLTGSRGANPSDVPALVEILQRLSRFATDVNTIDEMDLNPVFVYDEGEGAVIVDVRLKLGG